MNRWIMADNTLQRSIKGSASSVRISFTRIPALKRLRTSAQDLREIRRKRPNSRGYPDSNPSAMLFEIDKAARCSWSSKLSARLDTVKPNADSYTSMATCQMTRSSNSLAIMQVRDWVKVRFDLKGAFFKNLSHKTTHFTEKNAILPPLITLDHP